VTGYVETTWRLMIDGPADGATNMAVDEAILRAVAREASAPTVRLYAWEAPCLSLGRGQRIADVDRQAVEAAGYDLVRRPTGGRAILHIDELTYSVIVPKDDARVAGSVVESYRRLSGGLMRALELLGVPDLAADQRVEGRGHKGPVCFEVPSDYEITSGGRKLVGSAQMRAEGVVLQHGSVPLHGDIARICPLLASHPDPVRVRARATTVTEVLGRIVTWAQAADAMITAFKEQLNVQLVVGALGAEERQRATELRREKYGSAEWTGGI